MNWKFSGFPVNTRVIVAGIDEIAIGWLDRIDQQWYYTPQGGIIPWNVTMWMDLSTVPNQ